MNTIEITGDQSEQVAIAWLTPKNRVERLVVEHCLGRAEKESSTHSVKVNSDDGGAKSREERFMVDIWRLTLPCGTPYATLKEDDIAHHILESFRGMSKDERKQFLGKISKQRQKSSARSLAAPQPLGASLAY